MRITQKLAVAMLAVALTPALLIGWIPYQQTQRSLTDATVSRLESTATVQKSRLESLLAQYDERISELSSRFLLRSQLVLQEQTGSAFARQQIQQSIDEAKRVNPQIVEIAIYDAAGRPVASTGGATGPASASDPSFAQSRQGRTRPVVEKAPDGSLRVKQLSPLVLDGRLIGVISLISSGDALAKLAQDYTGLGSTGETVLVDRTDHNGPVYLTPLRFDPNAALTRTTDNDPRRPGVIALDGQETTLQKALDYRGQEVLAVTKYAANQDWGLFVKIDRTEAFAPVTKLRRLLTVALLAFGIVLAWLVYYASQLLTRRLRRLIEATRHITQGKFRHRLATDPPDELGQLAASINEMAGKLERYYADLRKQVAQGSRALADAHKVAKVGTWEWRGRRLHISPEMCRILGLPPKDDTFLLPGQHEVVHRADYKRLETAVRRAIRARGSFAVEHRIITPGGDIRLVSSQGEVSGPGRGLKGAFISGTTRDITEQKQLEQELHQMASTVENSQDAIIGLSRNGVVLSWNQGAESMYGYTAREIKSKHISVLMPPQRAPEFARDMTQVLKGQGYQDEMTHVSKTGRRLEVSITVSPTYDQSGGLTGMSMIARDITAQKELQQLQRDFVSIASHELRTPITALIGFLSMVQNNKQLTPEQARQFVARASQAASRLSALVEDLLSVARLEEGRMSFTLRPLDPVPLMRRVISGLKPKARGKDIKVSFTNKLPGRLKVEADSGKLEQVFVNLLDNAIKYTRPGGRVDVSVRATQAHLILSIKDTGIGIQRENLDRIYDKFFREYTELSVMAGGTGLGLFITKELVERQRGTLEIKSHPGSGTTATLRFPRRRPRRATR